MIKVGPQVFVVGIICLPVPSLPDLWPRKLILGDLRVHAGTGIAVPSPCSAEVVSCFVYYCFVATVTKGFEHEDAGLFYVVSLLFKIRRGYSKTNHTKASTDNDRIYVKIVGIWT
jgi:hypothetical protein